MIKIKALFDIISLRISTSVLLCKTQISLKFQIVNFSTNQPINKSVFLAVFCLTKESAYFSIQLIY